MSGDLQGQQPARSVRDRRRPGWYGLDRPAPQPTGGMERAIFELLRLVFGCGRRQVPIPGGSHPRRSVDMVFDLPAFGPLVIEYDGAYFHPFVDEDIDRTFQALSVLRARRVLRIREAPLVVDPFLEERVRFGAVDAISVPHNPEPTLCAAAVFTHLRHDDVFGFDDGPLGQERAHIWSSMTQVAIATYGEAAMAGRCSACMEELQGDV